MGIARFPTIIGPDDVESLLRSFGRDGERGRMLRAQLAERFPGRSAEEVEDAVQTACESFLEQPDGVFEPAAAYAWIRNAAYHSLTREVKRQKRVIAVDPVAGALKLAASELPGPAEELIALEDELDLEVLVREFADSLSTDRREILSLWGVGHKRPEIASRLGISERIVKRSIEEMMQEARISLAEAAGGGCEWGESLVLRFACGLASAPEAEQARAHLERCARCSAFSERLDAWREKVGALLPLPVAEAAAPGLVERVTHRVAHAVSSVKQQVLGGGAQLKEQAATATYARSADPTPLAGVRPGAALAVVMSCIAVGGSAATYCAQHGVDPLAAARGLIAGTQESEPSPTPAPAEASEPASVAPPSASEESPTTEASETTPAPEPEPEPAPEPEPTPPPEESFEPSSPAYSTTDEAPESASAPTVSASPAPVQGGGAPQFGGP
jgi:DNA-directed RNA polymerase specialized sigma24 family protein